MVSPLPAKPSPFALLIPPSTSSKPCVPLKAELIGALPKITIPPQSPLCGFGEREVNIIGSVGDPTATNLLPLVITKAATSAPLNAPLITVPASTVIVLSFTI